LQGCRPAISAQDDGAVVGSRTTKLLEIVDLVITTRARARPSPHWQRAATPFEGLSLAAIEFNPARLANEDYRLSRSVISVGDKVSVLAAARAALSVPRISEVTRAPERNRPRRCRRGIPWRGRCRCPAPGIGRRSGGRSTKPCLTRSGSDAVAGGAILLVGQHPRRFLVLRVKAACVGEHAHRFLGSLRVSVTGGVLGAAEQLVHDRSTLRPLKPSIVTSQVGNSLLQVVPALGLVTIDAGRVEAPSNGDQHASEPVRLREFPLNHPEFLEDAAPLRAWRRWVHEI
jgi:hypothetical protein